MSAHWLSLQDRVDPSWWQPLEALASYSQDHPDLPPVDADDYVYAARIARQGVPGLNVYRHVLTHRYLNVDDAGALWRYVGRATDPSAGYAPIEITEAFDRAELSRAELLAARTRRGRRRPLPEAEAEAESDPMAESGQAVSERPWSPSRPRLVTTTDDPEDGIGDHLGTREEALTSTGP